MLLMVQCKLTLITNALPFLHPKQNAPCYGNSHKNVLRWQQYFFSHSMKLCGLPLSAVTLAALAYLPRCLRSAVT